MAADDDSIHQDGLDHDIHRHGSKQMSKHEVYRTDTQEEHIYTYKIDDLIDHQLYAEVEEQIGIAVDTSSSGDGALTAYTIGPNDFPVPTEVEFDEEQGAHTVSFTPHAIGLYRASVHWSDVAIDGSPFVVWVAAPEKCQVRGGGGPCSGQAGQPTVLEIETAGAGPGRVTAVATGSDGVETDMEVTQREDDVWSCSCVLPTGTYEVAIEYNQAPINDSPLTLQVSDNSHCVLSGLPTEAKVNNTSSFELSVAAAGPGYAFARAENTDGEPLTVKCEKAGDDRWSCSFVPTSVGDYPLHVFYNNRELEGSPFHIKVSDPQKCKAIGDGLQQTTVNTRTTFRVETQSAGLGHVTAEAIHSNGDTTAVEKVVASAMGTYELAYTPTTVGAYSLNVCYNGAPIRDSPFSVEVINPSKVIVLLPENPPMTGETCEIRIVVPTEAGRGSVSATVTSETGEPPHVHVEVSGDDRLIKFSPEVAGHHEVTVFLAGELVHGSPFELNVQAPVDASKVIVIADNEHGGCINVHTNIPAIIRVDGRLAGAGNLSMKLADAVSSRAFPIDVDPGEVIDDGMYDVTYTIPRSGAYVMFITWGGKHVPGSPFKVSAKDKANASAVVVDGKGLTEGVLGTPVLFNLDGRSAGGGALTCQCKSPTGENTIVKIIDNKDGTFTVDLNATEPGLHNVQVEWDGDQIPGSPFMVRIMQAPDAKKVYVHGPGLQSGMIDDFGGEFKVETKGAGPGGLKVRIHGPKGSFKVEMSRDNPRDRVINVRYNPTEPGMYTANILWSEEHVRGSPFQIFVAQDRQQLEHWNQNRENIVRRLSGDVKM